MAISPEKTGSADPPPDAALSMRTLTRNYRSVVFAWVGDALKRLPQMGHTDVAWEQGYRNNNQPNARGWHFSPYVRCEYVAPSAVATCCLKSKAAGVDPHRVTGPVLENQEERATASRCGKISAALRFDRLRRHRAQAARGGSRAGRWPTGASRSRGAGRAWSSAC